MKRREVNRVEDRKKEKGKKRKKNLLGRRANAKSIVKKYGIAALGGVLNEIVLFRLFGGVPVTKSMMRRVHSNGEK